MKVIGITGGAGCGKTEILRYLESRYKCRVLQADRAAERLQEPGGLCYRRIVELLGTDILGPEGRIDRQAMATVIFGNKDMLAAVNAVIHPAVRTYILQRIEEAAREGTADFFFLEAALLIECGYEEIVDEMWYVYADEEARRARLKAGRQYSDHKTDAIFAAQLPEETYRAHCGFVIDNGREITYAFEQIDKKMGEYLWKK